ncbi:MAG TPA: nitroreductase family deazaflavin-dependent oxidoreductase [Candidatus Dormibacteraeota bacterium]|nr:nitroreductase family deazaflavin-dependent oxidoreductase [Candidatus Dormibacteraeota bacterium]
MSTYGDFNRSVVEDVRRHGKPTGGPFLGRNVLILTTKGAKSGEERTTPLVYSWEDGRHVIVASKGGSPTHPSWYHNLRRHPVVTVETEGKKFQATARVVGDEGYERLYKRHADENPSFWDYRKRTDRKIPVIVLEPIEQAKRA